MFRKKEVYAYDQYAGKPEKKKIKTSKEKNSGAIAKQDAAPTDSLGGLHWEEIPPEVAESFSAAPPALAKDSATTTAAAEFENLIEPNKKRKKPKPTKEKKAKKERPPNLGRKLTARGKAGIVLIAAALIISFVLVPYISKAAAGQTIEVIRATSNIAKGTVIDASAYEIVTMPDKGLIKGTIITAQELTGKLAATDISAGDFILRTKVTDTLLANHFLYELPVGKQAISIRLKQQELGLSGKLLPGDIVGVYASYTTPENDGSYLAIAPPELQYVQILSLSNEFGGSYDQEAAAGEMPQTVELLVNPAQASALAGLNQIASIHLALVSRGNADYAEQLLSVQERYLAELVANSSPAESEGIAPDMQSEEENKNE